jgi:hypothetical protein
MPSPSYNFLEASSRGERGISLEDEERGVVGEELDVDLDEPEPVEYASSLSVASAPSGEVSMATLGSGWEMTGLKHRGWGRVLRGLRSGGREVGWCSPSPGGGVTLTLGDVTMRLIPLRTELLLPPRLQEVAESDLDGVVEAIGEELGVPRGVPPLMTVVELGVGGRLKSSWSSDLDTVVLRLPNLPPRTPVMGPWSSEARPSLERTCSAWLARRNCALRVAERKSKELVRGPAEAGVLRPRLTRLFRGWDCWRRCVWAKISA